MVNASPLMLLEEFLLLALNEETGKPHPVNPHALNCATAGAILMELTLRNRIDNDLRDMFPIDPTPTGDDILDSVMQMVSLAPVLMPHPIVYWLRQIGEEGEAIREKVLRRLEKRGLIRNQKLSTFWMLGFKRGSALNGDEMRSIRARIQNTLFSEDVPSPRGIMLTGLLYSCGLFPFILSETEVRDAAARIEKISHMDLICQAVMRSIGAEKPPHAVVSAFK